MEREQLQITVGELEQTEFISYLYERENSEATVAKYNTDIRTFYRFLKDDSQVNKAKLVAYKEWLMERYAVSSANSMIAALNQFLIFLGAGSLRLKRICVQKQMFLKDEKEMSKSEYKKLVETARKLGRHKLALLMETICATGIRISELPYFTVSAVRRGKIEVRNKGKIRIILMPEALRKKLLYFAEKEQIKKGCIFVTRSGRPKNRSNIWAEMKALHKDAGVKAEKVFPHNLRHLFARVYYQMYKDIVGLADILGHSSLETTRIYMASVSDVYRERFQKMQLVI